MVRPHTEENDAILPLQRLDLIGVHGVLGLVVLGGIPDDDGEHGSDARAALGNPGQRPEGALDRADAVEDPGDQGLPRAATRTTDMLQDGLLDAGLGIIEAGRGTQAGEVLVVPGAGDSKHIGVPPVPEDLDGVDADGAGGAPDEEGLIRSSGAPLGPSRGPEPGQLEPQVLCGGVEDGDEVDGDGDGVGQRRAGGHAADQVVRDGEVFLVVCLGSAVEGESNHLVADGEPRVAARAEGGDDACYAAGAGEVRVRGDQEAAVGAVQVEWCRGGPEGADEDLPGLRGVDGCGEGDEGARLAAMATEVWVVGGAMVRWC